MALKCIINHIGFHTTAVKRVLLHGSGYSHFDVQDMQEVEQEQFSKRENWKTVFTGQLESAQSGLGDFLVGDFSDLTRPGTYRITVNDAEHWSYQFTISDRAFDNLSFLFLDFIHNWRSGDHGLHWRDPSNLDDAVRSDNGEQIDVTGGWYDAGDLRKWMVHTNLPLSGFLDIYTKKRLKRNAFSEEKISGNDFITESAWALEFMLKMQDPDTGMFFEDVAGGGSARETDDLSWWYENHAGCVADNSENHFTDNMSSSGDERTVRVRYNPIANYTTIYLLLKAARIIGTLLPELSEQCRHAALKGWHFMTGKQKSNDAFHTWTSVIAWKLMAALEIYSAGELSEDDLKMYTDDLLDLQSPVHGFWFMNKERNDPYRGILHSAQPLIALAMVHDLFPGKKIAEKIKASLSLCSEQYVIPATGTSPFRIMPYGFYFAPASDEIYRFFSKDLCFRFFMPDNSAQKLNHGLNGHWMSWSHAMALASRILNSDKLADLAWAQIYWALGNNPAMASLVTGAGYNNPMPHSRFLGPYPGGFMSGFIGDVNDKAVLDMEGCAQWNTTEYWNTPLANCMMALAELESIQ